MSNSATGAYSIVERGEDMLAEMLAVASGKHTKTELLGYGDCEFNPWKIGAVV